MFEEVHMPLTLWTQTQSTSCWLLTSQRCIRRYALLYR